MATIKNFTSLEQSRKLAEILPLESADMHYVLIDTDEDKYAAGLGKYIGILPHYPCWSLVALLDVLSNASILLKGFDKMYDLTNSSGEIARANNPVDACYEIILKLHERKML